jgi:hypothetical protein
MYLEKFTHTIVSFNILTNSKSAYQGVFYEYKSRLPLEFFTVFIF